MFLGLDLGGWIILLAVIGAVVIYLLFAGWLARGKSGDGPRERAGDFAARRSDQR